MSEVRITFMYIKIYKKKEVKKKKKGGRERTCGCSECKGAMTFKVRTPALNDVCVRVRVCVYMRV